MKRLVYAFPTALKRPEIDSMPGMTRYSYSSKIFGFWVMPIDRSGHIEIPINGQSLFPLPSYRPFTKTYEDICNDRAIEILKNADDMDVDMNVMYSGGIDSTCLLVSLLKNATTVQKKRIVVLLSQESIVENPKFFEEHIRGKLRLGSSVSFPKFIGEKNMLLSAEHNDLVMGNAALGGMISKYGPEIIHKPFSRETIVDFFMDAVGDIDVATFYFELFEGLSKTAPIPIRSNIDFLWWYNFTMKWQACFCFILFYLLPQNAGRINKEYLDTRFVSFYNTEAFQLWAMNNLDKRIRDTWKSYKWIIKDVIYDFTKDADYRDNKTKVRSLPIIMEQHPVHFGFLDDNFRFHTQLDLSDYTLPTSDFA